MIHLYWLYSFLSKIIAVVLESLLKYNLIIKEEYQVPPLELTFLKGPEFVKFLTPSATTIAFTFYVQHHQR